MQSYTGKYLQDCERWTMTYEGSLYCTAPPFFSVYLVKMGKQFNKAERLHHSIRAWRLDWSTHLFPAGYFLKPISISSHLVNSLFTRSSYSWMTDSTETGHPFFMLRRPSAAQGPLSSPGAPQHQPRWAGCVSVVCLPRQWTPSSKPSSQSRAPLHSLLKWMHFFVPKHCMWLRGHLISTSWTPTGQKKTTASKL